MLSLFLYPCTHRFRSKFLNQWDSHRPWSTFVFCSPRYRKHRHHFCMYFLLDMDRHIPWVFFQSNMFLRSIYRPRTCSGNNACHRCPMWQHHMHFPCQTYFDFSLPGVPKKLQIKIMQRADEVPRFPVFVVVIPVVLHQDQPSIVQCAPAMSFGWMWRPVPCPVHGKCAAGLPMRICRWFAHRSHAPPEQAMTSAHSQSGEH